MPEATVAAPAESFVEGRQGLLGRITGVFVFLFERIMPDPYIFAVVLTFVGAALALWLAPNATPVSIAAAWYAGVFNLFTFAFQMVIMLVAGYALATSPAIHSALERIVSLACTPASAISLTASRPRAGALGRARPFRHPSRGQA